MSDATDRTAAINHVKLAIQSVVAPVVSDTEVEQLVDDCRWATTWQAGATYDSDAVVMPITRNGHRYRCFIGGIAGITEPIWPKRFGAQVHDGQIVWREDGPQLTSIYDTATAIYRGWLLKAAKAQSCVDWKAGGITTSEGQVFEHCRQMAEALKPFGVF